MNAKLHWDKVYQTKQPTEVSWYRPHLDISLELIEEAASNRDAHIIDVGAGESTLVDDLLAGGYRNLYALDLSSTALDVAKARLVERRRERSAMQDVLGADSPSARRGVPVDDARGGNP